MELSSLEMLKGLLYSPVISENSSITRCFGSTILLHHSFTFSCGAGSKRSFPFSSFFIFFFIEGYVLVARVSWEILETILGTFENFVVWEEE